MKSEVESIKDGINHMEDVVNDQVPIIAEYEKFANSFYEKILETSLFL